jgi:hypothetical protein
MGRVWLVALVACAGCIAHAGPTVGWRAKQGFAIGWHGGIGATALEVIAGESYAKGRALSYGGVGGRYVRDDPTSGAAWTVGGMVGVGTDGRRGSGVVAVEGAGFAPIDRDHASRWGGSVTLGVRLLGGEVEVFVRPELMYLMIPPPDFDRE